MTTSLQLQNENIHLLDTTLANEHYCSDILEDMCFYSSEFDQFYNEGRYLLSFCETGQFETYTIQNLIFDGFNKFILNDFANIGIHFDLDRFSDLFSSINNIKLALTIFELLHIDTLIVIINKNPTYIDDILEQVNNDDLIIEDLIAELIGDISLTLPSYAGVLSTFGLAIYSTEELVRYLKTVNKHLKDILKHSDLETGNVVLTSEEEGSQFLEISQIVLKEQKIYERLIETEVTRIINGQLATTVADSLLTGVKHIIINTYFNEYSKLLRRRKTYLEELSEEFETTAVEFSEHLEEYMNKYTTNFLNSSIFMIHGFLINDMTKRYALISPHTWIISLTLMLSCTQIPKRFLLTPIEKEVTDFLSNNQIYLLDADVTPAIKDLWEYVKTNIKDTDGWMNLSSSTKGS